MLRHSFSLAENIPSKNGQKIANLIGTSLPKYWSKNEQESVQLRNLKSDHYQSSNLAESIRANPREPKTEPPMLQHRAKSAQIFKGSDFASFLLIVGAKLSFDAFHIVFTISWSKLEVFRFFVKFSDFRNVSKKVWRKNIWNRFVASLSPTYLRKNIKN